jgi:hypothetical protein
MIWRADPAFGTLSLETMMNPMVPGFLRYCTTFKIRRREMDRSKEFCTINHPSASLLVFVNVHDQKLSKDHELRAIFHFVNASISENDRVNSELCQINRHRAMEHIRMSINISSEAKNLKLESVSVIASSSALHFSRANVDNFLFSESLFSILLLQ